MVKCLKNCGGFISLQLGTIIAGCYDLFFVLLSFVGSAYVELRGRNHDDEFLQKIHPDVAAGTGYLFFALTYGACSLLIIGAVKRNVWFLLPWIILKLLYLICLIILIIFILTHAFSEHKIALGVLMLLLLILHTGISLYLWVVVLSFYLELTEE